MLVFLLIAGAWAQPSPIEQQLQSVEKQRAAMAATLAAVARQREGAVPGPRVEDDPEPALPPLAALTPSPALCDPLPPSTIDPIIETVARGQNLQTSLLRAVIA